MPTNALEFKVSLIRRAVRAAQREGMRVTHFDLLPDRTVRVYTVPQPPIDLTSEIESLLDESRGEVAA